MTGQSPQNRGAETAPHKQRVGIEFLVLFLMVYSSFCSITRALQHSLNALFPCAPSRTVAENVVSATIEGTLYLYLTGWF